jgi:hypothetical protein
MQNHRADMESSIQKNGFPILWHSPHEKMTACAAAGVCFRKIGGIGVDIQDHVTCVESDLCVRVARQVIQ